MAGRKLPLDALRNVALEGVEHQHSTKTKTAPNFHRQTKSIHLVLRSSSIHPLGVADNCIVGETDISVDWRSLPFENQIRTPFVLCFCFVVESEYSHLLGTYWKPLFIIKRYTLESCRYDMLVHQCWGLFQGAFCFHCWLFIKLAEKD